MDEAVEDIKWVIPEFSQSGITTKSENLELTDDNYSDTLEEKSLHTLESSEIFIEDTTLTEKNLSNFEIDKEYAKPDKLSKDEEKELTNQFLSGELSFSEYAARMLEEDDVDDDPLELQEIKDSNDEEEVGVGEEGELRGKEGGGGEKSEVNIVHVENNKRKSTNKKPRNKQSLPLALKGLMGEANLRCARGDHDYAIKMCLEIIRQAPKVAEPFQTLAGIYEELGHHEKALQMTLIAAHLSPSDAYQWIHLAETSIEQGNIKQAVTCYNKALNADVSMIDIHMKRVTLLEQLNEKKLALKAYSRLLSVIDSKETATIMNLSKMLAEKYHQEKDLIKAKESLEVAFQKCPQLITNEYINIMLEILIGLKQYKAGLGILTKFCGLKIESGTNQNNDFLIYSYSLESPLAVDLSAKLFIILIRLKAFNLLESIFTSLFLINPEEAGDIYFDVAESLMEEEHHTDALKLLSYLVKSTNYNLPAVWLRFAECNKILGSLEESIQAYLIVIEKAPHHLGARLAVAELLNQLNRKEEAIKVLTQEEDSETLDPVLLYERCLLLLEDGQIDQFLSVGHLLVSRHFAQINCRDDLHILTMQRSDKKRYVPKDTRFLKLPSPDNSNPDFSQNIKEPSIDDEWTLFWTMCEKCLEVNRPDLLQRLAFSAQSSQRFGKYSQEIDLLCLSSCYYNVDAYYGYNIARTIVLKNLHCPRAWNFFNLILLKADDSRHNRFLMRLLSRNQDHNVLAQLHANNCLVAGTYKYALSEYTSVFQKENSPMTAFLVGITLCQMACQKFSAKKHSLVSQFIAYFWKYRELRGTDGLQEVYYNFGRAFHQLGLLPAAIFNYKKALAFSSPFLEEHKACNLKREAAFNLYLIYLSSGATDLARMTIENNIEI